MSVPPYVRDAQQLAYYLVLQQILGDEQEVAEAWAAIDAACARAVAGGYDPARVLHFVAEPYTQFLRVTNAKLRPEYLCRCVEMCLAQNQTFHQLVEGYLIPQALGHAPLPATDEASPLPDQPSVI